jgi:hypothetical protein
MENKGYVMYDNYNVDYDEWYEEFKDWCYDNDIDASNYGKDSENFHNWVWNTLNMYWDDFIYNLQHDKDNNVDCVVTGKVGRWNGNFDIVATHFATLEKAIYACIKDCDYITITQTEDGAIDVYASHHDGSHSFTIHKLNERGYDAKCDEDNDLNNEKYFDKFNIQY